LEFDFVISFGCECVEGTSRYSKLILHEIKKDRDIQVVSADIARDKLAIIAKGRRQSVVWPPEEFKY
jgi:hypothetical protein